MLINATKLHNRKSFVFLAIMLHKNISIVLVCININAFTQTCSITISGKISDKHDNSALDYATLYIAETGLITTADSTGKYSLSNICPGKYIYCRTHQLPLPIPFIYLLYYV